MFNAAYSVNGNVARCATPRLVIVARYAVETTHGQRPLPSSTDTLPLAEAFRRDLMRQCRAVVGVPQGAPGREALCARCPAILGKDGTGQPLQGHRHAYFLPADEDGDGRLDHITVVAEQGFAADEVQALDRLRAVRFGEGDPLRLLLVGLGTDADFRSSLFEQSTTWVSATPFLASRYPKLRGRKRDHPEHYATAQKFAGYVLQQEIDRLRERRPDLPEAVAIESLEALGEPRTLRPLQFQLRRQKRGDDGVRRPRGAFRLTFTAPVAGPLCLGHSCHFGLGLFLPERRGADQS